MHNDPKGWLITNIATLSIRDIQWCERLWMNRETSYQRWTNHIRALSSNIGNYVNPTPAIDSQQSLIPAHPLTTDDVFASNTSYSQFSEILGSRIYPPLGLAHTLRKRWRYTHRLSGGLGRQSTLHALKTSRRDFFSLELSFLTCYPIRFVEPYVYGLGRCQWYFLHHINVAYL